MADEFDPTPRGTFDAPGSGPEAPTSQAPPPGYAAPPPPVPPVAYSYPPAAYPPPAGYGYPPPKRRSGWFWVAIIGGIFAVMIAVVCLTCASLAKSFTGDDTEATGFASGSSIGVIDITGVILDADKIDKQLDRFGDDSNVKAIVLHIDSPGGGAAASQEIYHEVMRIRTEKHKYIVASVESVGASGAYYIASACDKIYANPASVVGSIGVIMEWTNYGELMRWAKLKNITIHAGELKDAGDPTRDLTPKEEAYFQSLVDNMYGQFIHDVAEGRHTSDDAIKPLATGQVWTGQQALGLHLIDAEGGFHTALMETASHVGISGEPKILKGKQRPGFFESLNEDTDSLFPNPSKLLDHAPGFYFMWK
jgi:protease-4